MVGKLHYIKTDAFFGGGNELIEWKGKGVCTFIGTMLKRGSNEPLDSSFNPVAETIFLRKLKTVNRVEIKTKKFSASEVNARQDISQVRHLEDVMTC